MPALEALERSWREVREDAGFQDELAHLLRRLRGSSHAPLRGQAAHRRLRWRARVPQARGPLPHRRAQAEQRARAGPARQAAWARSGSSPRPVPASTAWPRPRACALIGLTCEVYMGAVDIERQAPNVARMELLGAKVIAVQAGTADPEGRAQRGAARLGDERPRHALRPRQRRRSPSVPLDGAGVPERDRHTRRARSAWRASDASRMPWSPAWAVAPTPSASSAPSSRIPPSSWSRWKPQGRDWRAAGTARPSHAGRPACCTARAATSCRTRTDRWRRHTPSARDSTIPASDPSSRTCGTVGASPWPLRPIGRPWTPWWSSPAPRGSSRALESAHAIAETRRVAQRLGGKAVVVVGLSGRGDKDLETVRRHLGGAR